jgi:hypothetical protein
MQQTLVNMQAAPPQAPPPPLRDRLGEFQRTKPPTFSQAMEPMDTDDWLKSVEKKLRVVLVHERTTLSLDSLVTAHILIMVIIFRVGLLFLL